MPRPLIRTLDAGRNRNTYGGGQQLIEVKRTGAPPPKPSPRPKENVKDLAAILRNSLEAEGIAPPKRRKSRAKTAH